MAHDDAQEADNTNEADDTSSNYSPNSRTETLSESLGWQFLQLIFNHIIAR